MASAEGDEHLKETKLEGSNVEKILEDFEKWLAKAHFEVADRAKSKMLEICDDPGRYKASQPLLNELGVYNQVTSFE